MSTYTVTNVNDSGSGSLRAAMTSAASDLSPTIVFQADLVGTIELESSLVISADTSLHYAVYPEWTIDGSGAKITLSGSGFAPFTFVGNPYGSYLNPLVINDLTFDGFDNFQDSNANNEGNGLGNCYVNNCTFVNFTGCFNALNSIHWTFTSCTFSNNTLTGESGFLYSPGVVSFVNCTITGNTWDCFSAIINTSVTLLNTIVYGNSNFSNAYGSPSATYSDIQGGYSGTGNIDSDPGLGSLTNNGGCTDTMAITSSSPCFLTGTSTGAPTTSQNGIVLPSPPSMGAYQVPPPNYAGRYYP